MPNKKIISSCYYYDSDDDLLIVPKKKNTKAKPSIQPDHDDAVIFAPGHGNLYCRATYQLLHIDLQ